MLCLDLGTPMLESPLQLNLLNLLIIKRHWYLLVSVQEAKMVARHLYIIMGLFLLPLLL
jgi:hypothetical protein